MLRRVQQIPSKWWFTRIMPLSSAIIAYAVPSKDSRMPPAFHSTERCNGIKFDPRSPRHQLLGKSLY